MHLLPGGLHDGQEGAADVADVHQGPPGCAVTLEQHLAGGEGVAGQVVHHQVPPQPRRDAVGRGVAQEARRERVVRLGVTSRSTKTFDSP